jgi:hypothetical protein
MRNLYNPARWYAVINGAGEKEQQDIFHPYGVPFSAHPNGEWVLWTDYLHLLESYKVVQKREGELSIQATVDEIAISQMKAENDRLKAEVERLSKAGDLMCRMAGNNQVINRHWKTAKKGVQS